MARLSTKDHRFQPLEWRDHVLPRGAERQNTAHLFQGRPKTSPAWLREVMGKNRVPKYWSPAPANEITPHLDMLLAAECKSRDDWALAQTSWLCALAGDRSPEPCVVRGVIRRLCRACCIACARMGALGERGRARIASGVTRKASGQWCSEGGSEPTSYSARYQVCVVAAHELPGPVVLQLGHARFASALRVACARGEGQGPSRVQDEGCVRLGRLKAPDHLRLARLGVAHLQVGFACACSDGRRGACGEARVVGAADHNARAVVGHGGFGLFLAAV